MPPGPTLVSDAERRDAVLDVLYVAISIAFFGAILGYVALCERLAAAE
jgi:hypothetical protein